ncbi:hypothetical protein MG293_012658 [Ovis ammon polii]|uniref:Uncharacterized protein n=1 Tax=Ovis ammon polii TaxID=230172 RepID=A0AAD4U571_OVIAM|nr:hypothetical protein MG293_012658 [Ovis ammon polii]
MFPAPPGKRPDGEFGKIRAVADDSENAKVAIFLDQRSPPDIHLPGRPALQAYRAVSRGLLFQQPVVFAATLASFSFDWESSMDLKTHPCFRSKSECIGRCLQKKEVTPPWGLLCCRLCASYADIEYPQPSDVTDGKRISDSCSAPHHRENRISRSRGN